MKKMTMTIDNGNGKKEKKTLSPSGKKVKKPLDPKQKRRRRMKIILGTVFTTLLVTGGYLFYRANYTLDIMGINTNPSGTLGNILLQKDPELEKDRNNRTNMLLVGIDTRQSNPGLQNTDTIIIASYDHDTHEGIMLSLPRDLWVEYPDLPGYFTKINGIYNYCENQEKGTGLECLVSVTEEISQLDIQYYGMVDIQGLVDVIDLLGGVEVDVERAFTDYMFPNSNGNSWEMVSFEEGVQHMDGETAMKYARSRHAAGPEGSDFARARRQQRLILAIKDKFLSSETLQNPLTIFEIAEELGESIKLSDVSTEDIRAALALAKKEEDPGIYTFVLDPTAGNWTLITEDPSAAYVLFPKAGEGNWTEIHKYLEEVLANPALYSEKAKIYVYNGGYGYNETYAKFQELTEDYPYLDFTFGGNASLQTYTGNNIFDFKEDPPLASLNEMEFYFDTKWSSDIPDGLISIYGEDIAIILGAEPAVSEGAGDSTGSQ